MSDSELLRLLEGQSAAPWRVRLARFVESPRIQWTVVAVILLNSAVLGLETVQGLDPSWMRSLEAIDRACLAIFVVELLAKGAAYRWQLFRSGWNVFDLLVVGVALVPAAESFSVLRTLRILRVFRLLTVIPQLRRVVAAFLHAIPGLSAVILVLLVFYYAAAVMATSLFAATQPRWFGSLGDSFYTLFQIMTLESWSMGIVRPTMQSHPWAWAFFVPFIMIATFTILNLFIGIIVSTMQELATRPEDEEAAADVGEVVERLEQDLARLKSLLDRDARS